MDRERQEALFALDQALGLCHAASDKLKSAKGWGLFDIVGGGMISSLIKHGRIDEAKSVLIDLESQLGVVKKELGELSMELRNTLHLSTGHLAFDIFFDNLFSDIHTQSKINQTLHLLGKLSEELAQTIEIIKQEE